MSMSKIDVDKDGTITEFSAKLQQALRVKHTGNFVYSPLGVSLLMGMVQLGSVGNTAKEIAQSLGFPEDNDSLIQVFKNASELLKMEKSVSDSFVLRTSQRIFIQKLYSVQPEYLEKLVRIFDSGIQLMDFSNDNAKKNAKIINAWVEKATDAKIKDCIDAKALGHKSNPDPLRLMMVNTVYFHGKWKVPFEAAETTQEEFYVNDGRDPWELIEVDMMHSNHRQFSMFEYVYLEILDAELVKVPYKNTRFSMIIFVPKFRDGLTKIQENISTVSLKKCLTKLKNYTQEMKKRHVIFRLSMPKFKFECDLNIQDSLRMIGINDAFQFGKAEFSGISDNPEGLFISGISQKAVIEVDELGTTAAAATRVFLAGGGCPEVIIVNANRSFYFQIVDEELEIVIFSGALIDPTKST